MVDALDRDGLLPAIIFIFSRAGCDGAVTAVRPSGMRLMTGRAAGSGDRRRERRGILPTPTGRARVLAVAGRTRARHRRAPRRHAAAFKEIVEELFVAGLVKVVFATETLALGINMPARTVVLEQLTKFNGESRVEITPGEYTQLTGRAGRRGIDVEGHAVVAVAGGA